MYDDNNNDKQGNLKGNGDWEGVRMLASANFFVQTWTFYVCMPACACGRCRTCAKKETNTSACKFTYDAFLLFVFVLFLPHLVFEAFFFNLEI